MGKTWKCFQPKCGAVTSTASSWCSGCGKHYKDKPNARSPSRKAAPWRTRAGSKKKEKAEYDLPWIKKRSQSRNRGSEDSQDKQSQASPSGPPKGFKAYMAKEEYALDGQQALATRIEVDRYGGSVDAASATPYTILMLCQNHGLQVPSEVKKLLEEAEEKRSKDKEAGTLAILQSGRQEWKNASAQLRVQQNKQARLEAAFRKFEKAMSDHYEEQQKTFRAEIAELAQKIEALQSKRTEARKALQGTMAAFSSDSEEGHSCHSWDELNFLTPRPMKERGKEQCELQKLAFP